MKSHKRNAGKSIELFSDPDNYIDVNDNADDDLYAEFGIESEQSFNSLSDDAKTLKQLELALWGSGQSVWMWNRDNNCIDLKFYINNSQEVSELTFSFEELSVNLHPDDADEFLEKWAKHLSGTESELSARLRFLRDQDYRWYEIKGKVIAFEDTGAISVIGTFSDITDSVDNETKLSLMSQAFAKSKQPMLVLAQNMYIAEYNEAWVNELDPYQVALNATSFTDLVEITKADMADILQNGYCEKTTDLSIPGQPTVPIEIIINEFSSKDLSTQYYIVLVKDLSDSIATEREMHRLATRDQVTGLINRFELQNQLTELIAQQTPLEIFYIDLNGVKEVSDALGHENKDTLLQNVASGLSRSLHNVKHLASWGGNEFVAVFCGHEKEAIKRTVDAINTTIANKVVINGDQKFVISSNIGVSRYPEDSSDVSELLRKADAALYYSKLENNENYSVYSKGMADEIKSRISMINDLREAIDKSTLTFVLQGKYNCSRELIGAEILCRWMSEKHGPVSPGVFIPLIEQYGMEFSLGLLALQNAINYIKVLDSLNIKIPISVNISATQVLDESFHKTLQTMIRIADIKPELLELEMTESVFISDDNSATTRLKALKSLGVRISLDDFGTGYSSLSYLGQYHFDVVKIDRTFIIEIEHDTKAKKLFDAIMNICTALELDVVVEGIETENQFDILCSTGVDKFQGFLLGRPSNMPDFLNDNEIH
ncbi:MAG: EAL domain-containing protein [Glaciecola sp.]